jgi:DNA invertase Pin-like site-specific DNA recombinase
VALFDVVAMIAEFIGELIRARTKEGMRVAKAMCERAAG